MWFCSVRAQILSLSGVQVHAMSPDQEAVQVLFSNMIFFVCLFVF